MQKTLIAWAFLIYAVLNLLSMATMSIGAALLIAALLLAAATDPASARRLRETLALPAVRTYLCLSILLLVACAITLVFAKIHPRGFNGEVLRFSFPRAMAKSWYLIFPALIVFGLRSLDESRRTRILQAWLITFGVLSVIGIIQYFTGWPRPQAIPGNPGRFHATLFLGHHLSVASILIFPFFAALDFSRFRDNPSRLPRALLVAFVALGFVTLFLTFSRTLWVALPAGIALWVLWVVHSRVRWPLAALLVILAALATQIPVIHSRLHDTVGITPREELWKANLEFFRHWPAVGTGWLLNGELSGMYLREKFPGQEVFGSHAHNNLLHMLGGTGLLGTLPWIAWCLWILILFARRLTKIPGGKGLFCAWIVFHINGLTQVNFWEGKVLHQMMWVVGWTLFWVVSLNAREEPATPRETAP